MIERTSMDLVHFLNWEYPKFVDGRVSVEKRDRQCLAALGLAGEAGEVSEIWKKHIFHGKPLDREKLIDEMGDVFWYFTLMMIDNAITLEEICDYNIAKLTARDAARSEQ